MRKGYLNIKDLYSGDKHRPYYYTYGFSWRAYAAYIAGILINIVGFVGSVQSVNGPQRVPKGAQYIYNVSYFAGIIVSGLCYYILCLCFPVPATSSEWYEAPLDDDEISSVTYGEAVEEPESDYGLQKYEEEDDTKNIASSSKAATVV